MSSVTRRQFGRWVLAQSEGPGPDGDVSAAETSSGERSPVEKKKLAVSVASMLIGGILVLGFLLLAMVFLLGRRARRIATERGRPIGTPDPLWYLRRKKGVPQLDESDSRGDAADNV